MVVDPGPCEDRLFIYVRVFLLLSAVYFLLLCVLVLVFVCFFYGDGC